MTSPARKGAPIVRTFPHPPVYKVPDGLRAAGSVQVPPSKSIAHRALILGALASR